MPATMGLIRSFLKIGLTLPSLIPRSFLPSCLSPLSSLSPSCYILFLFSATLIFNKRWQQHCIFIMATCRNACYICFLRSGWTNTCFFLVCLPFHSFLLLLFSAVICDGSFPNDDLIYLPQVSTGRIQKMGESFLKTMPRSRDLIPSLRTTGTPSIMLISRLSRFFFILYFVCLLLINLF